jgi:type I restriction enzyme S subunit
LGGGGVTVDLPTGWIVTALDQVFEPRSTRVSPDDFPESPYVGLEHVEAHSSKLLGTVPAGTMSSSAARFLAGDVLYGRMRPYLNKVVLLPFDGLASAEFIVFPATEGVNSRFLLWRLLSRDFVEFACGQYEGDRPRVKFDKLGKFQLYLPPAAEQTRIVEKLEELLSDLDAGVAELKAAQKKLTRYRQSLLKAAVEGALTAEWRKRQPAESAESGAALLARILTERRSRWETRQLAKFQAQGKTPPKDWQAKYPAPVAPDTAGLPALPEGWVWGSLEQLAEFITSGSRGWADYYAQQGSTFIRSQNINKDRLDLSDIAFVNPPPSTEGARTLVKMDDLLLTITGANVGKAARVDIELQEAYVSQHVALIRLVDAALGSYLHLFLTAGAGAGGRGQLNKEAYGAGKPGLNLQQVGAVVVPLPGEQEVIALMQAISAQLNAVQAQETAIAHSLKQSAAQRKNILQAAFSGQLVPQHPADEPASALLARIRAERAARAASPGRGRGKTKGST